MELRGSAASRFRGRSARGSRSVDVEGNALAGQYSADHGNPASVTIVNVGHRSTNYWVVGAGHSDHCVALLLDNGSVFTGDLPPAAYAFDNPVALATWRRIREHGATRVYTAHGPVWSIEEFAPCSA